jgi:hypothetical protein
MGVDYRAAIVIGYSLDDEKVCKALRDDEELELDEYVFQTNAYENSWIFGQRIFTSEQTEINSVSQIPAYTILCMSDPDIFGLIQEEYMNALDKHGFDIEFANTPPRLYLVQEIW